MEMSRINFLLDRARAGGHPTRSLLASIHRGDAFTFVFSKALTFLVWILGLAVGLLWLLSWRQVYYEYERWELMLAFVDQFLLLGILYVVLHITYLRASHLRQIPPGHYVSLQAVALILRWLGECILIMSLGALVHAILGVPTPGWLATVFGGPATEGDLKAGIKAFSLFTNGWLQIFSFLVFTIFYALASGIEAVIAIERNTRAQDQPSAVSGEVSSRGREVRSNRDNAFAPA